MYNKGEQICADKVIDKKKNIRWMLLCFQNLHLFRNNVTELEREQTFTLDFDKII